MTWIFQGKPISEDDIPDTAIGFIYVIHCPDQTKYIGRKLLTKAAYKTVNGKRKKIRKPSDWADYWSSSPDLLIEIEQVGKFKYVREIMMFCSNKTLLNYAETNLQHRLGVLHDDRWKNRNISMRFYKKNIENKPELKELEKICQKLK